MALDPINVGTVPNDDTGDTLRAAFQKVNNGFLVVDALEAEDVEAYLVDLPNGPIFPTHGGAIETYVPVNRDGVGVGAVPLGEGAYMPVAAPDGPPEIIATQTISLPIAWHGLHKHLTHATPAVTIPPQSTTAYPIGYHAMITFDNDTIINLGVGVTLRGPLVKPLTASAPGPVALIKLADNDWIITGPLSGTLP